MSRFPAAVLFVLTSIQAAVSVTEEPRHKVVFTNQYVRVIDAALPVGDATLFHTHDLDNVPIVIAGGTIRTRVAAGATSDTTLEIGRAWFAKAAYTHQIANIGTTPLRFIDAEIRTGWNRSSPDEADPAIPQESTIIENAIVRVARIQLPPRTTLEGHSHPRPVLHVEVSGGSVDGVSRAPGGFTWLEPGNRHSVRITSDGPYEAVIVEWK
jgi:hypothetical protein